MTLCADMLWRRKKAHKGFISSANGVLGILGICSMRMRKPGQPPGYEDAEVGGHVGGPWRRNTIMSNRPCSPMTIPGVVEIHTHMLVSSNPSVSPPRMCLGLVGALNFAGTSHGSAGGRHSSETTQLRR
eukprot:COSAG02_NODE_8226_length_2651_cov_2.615204_3_plen_129_part_00